jgi:hypothetical protein
MPSLTLAYFVELAVVGQTGSQGAFVELDHFAKILAELTPDRSRRPEEASVPNARSLRPAGIEGELIVSNDKGSTLRFR